MSSTPPFERSVTSSHPSSTSVYASRGLNPARLAAIVDHAGRTILDVGCGNGAYVLRLADQFQIRGIDRQSFDAWKTRPDLFTAVAFVLPSFARGWILEAICHEIRRRYSGTSVLVDQLDAIPPARAYFFAHYGFLAPALLSTPHVWAVPRIAFFTHPREPDLGGPEAIFALNRATKVVSMCSLFTKYLVGLGVRREIVTTSLVGADPLLFRPHVRGNGGVGFCTAYYERKNPDRILDIVRLMPHRKFALLGRNWREYSRFRELVSLPNFEYREAAYADYPAFYAGLDVFVSPAQMEGGPIPLLEAMMSNMIPVAARTGFAPDLIRHGQNGFLFDVDASTEQIVRLIDDGFNSKTDVRATVLHLTWERFVGDVARYFP